MEKQIYARLGETLYSETLANGLQVHLLPRKGYHKTYAMFTTHYGSIDNEFVPIGTDKPVHVPDGIAHFLEHKMFDQKDHDVFETFGKYGADSNAFTSYTRTSYLFSCTDHVKQNLETLLDFVQEPYFTEQSVNKEKGIIAQEIQMYEDDPNWQLFSGILANLYPQHPVRLDIAGTVDSIQAITPDELYTAYNTFYNPSNMDLFVTGKLVPDEMMGWIRANQEAKEFPQAAPIQRFYPTEAEDGSDILPYRVLEMSVQRPKSIVGLKGLHRFPEDENGLKDELALNLLFQMLFGSSSKNYTRLYDAGTIDDSFGYEIDVDRSFNFATISGDANNAQEFSDAIIDILEHYPDSPELTNSHLQHVERGTIGKYLQSWNSLEAVANQFTDTNFGDANLFEVLPILDSLTLDDIKHTAAHYIDLDALSVFHILPKDTTTA
ncbi:zinc-dependent proteinase [Lactobacillus selangorensis]|uniref:Zinc-dependent proteinase n=1 Tax=Lactobacillus selangorensis TaxID=81857 RepID=A0A0R2FTH5_9LACO|nr:pitrilysin family protein [Lactobacillus selangorensis]KRN28460.1 zinc-dependent proteinase [Lactobacillus selangorensis]KRN31961.1 zinc-dependent proteinase [Lactobacillus selangorensis]